MLLAAGLLAACDRHAVESWLEPEPQAASPASLYSDEVFAKGWAELGRRVPSPVRALSLLVYPDHMVLQAQNPAALSTVLQYVYRDGAVQKPVTVKLLGTGKLDDNLFSLDAARVDTIPALVRAARAKVLMPDGDVARVLLKRSLPESSDVEFRVYVTSQRRDAWVIADHNGKIKE